MASFKKLITLNPVLLRNTVSILRVPQYEMSQYPSYFVEPVFKKEQQKTMSENNELAKLSHIPIKAAQNDQTSSIMHDDLIRLFTNYVMKAGQKVLARDLVEKAFENIKRIQLQKYHSSSEEEKQNNFKSERNIS